MQTDKHSLKKNRLQRQTSPYLLQHASNPVDWFPWGEEAFQRAAAENKPIFLSIGYSSCHWCHVMARESFADHEIAALMNRVFVSIKVDREERPDIDQLYMQVCHMMTGRGGWPLTIILTPDKKPVFAATYLPPRSRGGMLGMAEMTFKMEELWQQQRQKVRDSAEQIADSIELAMAEAKERQPLNAALSRRAYEELLSSYDSKHGGFGTAPKFPSLHTLLFLLYYWKQQQNETARQMAEFTLRQMRRGGIFDQIGFGFHRYSTDASWILPHFEKMLYDQAMFALVYADAYAAFGDREFADTVHKTIDYVLHTLSDQNGAFFSAQDAESDGEEGKYYVWSVNEVMRVLGSTLGAFAVQYFSMTGEGNFADESTGRKNGTNIALRQKSITELAEQLGLSKDEAASKGEEVRSLLAAARKKRAAPRIDDKILVDWNGLMIGALARSGRILDQQSYIEAAGKAAEFLWQNCRKEKSLSHCYCKGQLSGVGFLSDYTFFSWGLFELYQSTFEARYLKRARILVDDMLQRFWDKDQDDFFYNDPEDRDLFLPTKETADSAIPSCTSIALFLLNRLAILTGENRFTDHALKLSASLGGGVSRMPQAFLATLYFHAISEGEGAQIVFSGHKAAVADSPMLAFLRSGYFPELAVYLDSEAAVSPLAQLIPGAAGFRTSDEQPTAYLCKNRQCLPPVRELGDLKKQLAA